MTLATDAIIGAMASPSMPGTAYVLFHHVMGESNGVRGVWGYVRGGMGGISNAHRRARPGSAAPRSGPTPRWRASWSRTARVQGVALADGTEIRAPRVASGVDAHVTFLKLMRPRRPAGGVRRGGAATSTTPARAARSTSR